MRALLAALFLATTAGRAAMEVRPVAGAATLVRDVSHGKPVVLHFWATWCGACHAEFPRLRAALLRLPAQGVSVALVSIDELAQREKAEEMLGTYQLTALPAILLEAPDPGPVAKAVGDPKWDGTLPATFVFDARGKLVKSFIGVTSPGALAAAVRKVLRAR